MEVSSPPVPRLFPRTLYGTSFWARFLFRALCLLAPPAPGCRVVLQPGPGGLTGDAGRQPEAFRADCSSRSPRRSSRTRTRRALRHADETGWRVQALRGEDRSSRAWLWTSVSNDAVSFHIDPSRSAEAALELFAEGLLDTVIVCDRYSAYKRLARLREGKVTLAFCWSHYAPRFYRVRGRPGETDGLVPGMDRADRGDLPRLNEARLEHYDPGLERRDTGVRRGAGRVGSGVSPACSRTPKRSWPALSERARRAKPLRSLLNHREGLCVFVGKPQVPDGQQQGRARAPGASHRTTIKLRFEQRGRRQVHGDHVLGGGHALDERHRRPALAGSVARSLREERPQTAG